ncbi:MAG: hypothetical protein FWD71_03205 [Oscillospiraceae bacterium]|nr:hypothetical protein [Oscillospiraceae bacterium]
MNESDTVRNINITKKTNRANVKKSLYITSILFFAIVFILSAVIFYFSSYSAAHFLEIAVLIVAAIIIIIVSFIICSNYAKMNGAPENSADGMDYDKTKNMTYYLKRMWLAIILLVLISIAISFAGGFILGGFMSGFRNKITNSFLQGIVLKGPMFIIYMIIIYNMFIKQGFMDAERKIFNLSFKILSVITAFIFMIPNMIFDSMYDTYYIGAPSVNVHSVLSPNIDLYLVDPDSGKVAFNSHFNMILVIFTVLLTLTIEFGVMVFAYKRGKKCFIDQHTRKLDKNEEYQIDERF